MVMKMRKLLGQGKSQKIEQKIYESMGIRLFRKLIFKIENIKHRQDRKRNINYHLNGCSVSSMEKFIGYLFYNAACHIISLAFVLVYVVASVAFKTRNQFLDLVSAILSIVNIYCIILQRYTYLKLNTIISKKNINRKNTIESMASVLKQSINERKLADLLEESELVQKIYEHVQNGTDCILSASDAPVLARISDACGNVISMNRTPAIHSAGIKKEPHCRLLIKTPYVVNNVEKRAAKLQRIVHSDKRTNLLFGFGILTETPECEIAYQRLFPSYTRDSMELLLEALIKAYGDCKGIEMIG